MHVMGLPSDASRVMVLTEGLTQESIFYKPMESHHGPYLHHMALQVDNVDLVFDEVRRKGWETTAEEPSFDLATGLRQFFLKEEETGCILEFIGRKAENAGAYGSGSSEFGIGNIVALLGL
jgi:4-hydroxyphenylpyruvate dioxygenase-like putative hemolysin